MSYLKKLVSRWFRDDDLLFDENSEQLSELQHAPYIFKISYRRSDVTLIVSSASLIQLASNWFHDDDFFDEIAKLINRNKYVKINKICASKEVFSASWMLDQCKFKHSFHTQCYYTIKLMRLDPLDDYLKNKTKEKHIE